MTPNRMTLFVAAFALTHVCALAAAATLPSHVTLYCAFEEGLHSSEGAVKPFSASGYVTVEPGGAGRGNVAHFRGHEGLSVPEKSAMIFDGVNLPVERGTVGLLIRCSGNRTWADGKRTYLLGLVPQVGEALSTTTDNGTGLLLYKDSDNALVLGAYQFHDARLTPEFCSAESGFEIAEPDSIVARIPVADLPADGWVAVRVGWDRETETAWLGVGDTIESSPVSYRPASWLCLLLGTPPAFRYNEAIGFDGDIDDLIVETRTPAESPVAGLAAPDPAPVMARPMTGDVEAVCFKDDSAGSVYERVVRGHLDNVIRLQEKHGGWTFSGAWPSGMWFLSTKVVIPYTHNYFNGSKDGNSAACAMQLLIGYMTLGEARYLAAAERTAATLMRIQGPRGCWPYSAIHDPESDTFTRVSPHVAPLEDHVQAHPTLLLMLLHKLTGKEEYRESAERGLAFILETQNPRGSWSHHWNLEKNIGEAAQSQYKNAGELNDDATQDQMKMMLAGWRMTGEIKYLAAFLRAADWIKSAFIDEKAKGWAQQYDEDNNPIPARHFEPPAISLSEGVHSIPRVLMLAYRVTGDTEYLEPCYRWREWMLDNRVFTNDQKTEWGWHTYYDPATGEAYRTVKGERLPADPKAVSERSLTSLLKEIERAEEPRPAPPSPEEHERVVTARVAAVDGTADGGIPKYPYLVEAFDWTAGTWLFSKDSPNGPSVAPHTPRLGLVAYDVMLRRQVAGQVSWDHPVRRMNISEWASGWNHLVPPDEMTARVSPDELARARAYIEELRAREGARTTGG